MPCYREPACQCRTCRTTRISAREDESCFQPAKKLRQWYGTVLRGLGCQAQAVSLLRGPLCSPSPVHWTHAVVRQLSEPWLRRDLNMASSPEGATALSCYHIFYPFRAT